MLLYDKSGADISGVIGPLEEGSALILICEVRGGKFDFIIMIGKFALDHQTCLIKAMTRATVEHACLENAYSLFLLLYIGTQIILGWDYGS